MSSPVAKRRRTFVASAAAASSDELYLDTVARARLDFDFRPVCASTLRTHNVYTCLVCGISLHGRGAVTPAHFHTLNEGHRVWMRRDGGDGIAGGVWVMPPDDADAYEYVGHSLDDIKQVVAPSYSIASIDVLDTSSDVLHRDLAGREFVPGFVGLNSIKGSDALNAVVQVLVHVPPLRDMLLLIDDAVVSSDTASDGGLLGEMARLCRRIWNARAFKGHTSPHDLVHAVARVSGNRFPVDSNNDPLDLLVFLLNGIAQDLKAVKEGATKGIVAHTFQGRVRVETRKLTAATGVDADANSAHTSTPDLSKGEPIITTSPFLFLSLDLPPAPLFQDTYTHASIIPQVSLVALLEKFNGRMAKDESDVSKKYTVQSWPDYVVLCIRRFTKQLLWTTRERNPTVVNFPLTDLEMMGPDSGKYDLVANICHEGREEAASYKVFLRRQLQAATDAGDPSEQWYMLQDLTVKVVMPQVIFLSNSYIQIWEKQRATVD